MQNFTLGRGRRVDIFPVSAGKYMSEEIKTRVRLCESALSALSLLRPLLFHSRFPPLLAPFVLHGWGFAFGRGGGHGLRAVIMALWEMDGM